MQTRFEGLPDAEKGIVYVRSVAVDTLPDEVRAQLGDLTTVYSVHRANGTTVALVANRELAFSLAREHDMAPVSVH
jgi:hypothetical protein